MFGDMFEIEFAYLRSRFKRIRKVAIEMKNQLVKEGKIDHKRFKQEFKKADKNFLEPEFEIRKNNTYVKIFDDNL